MLCVVPLIQCSASVLLQRASEQWIDVTHLALQLSLHHVPSFLSLTLLTSPFFTHLPTFDKNSAQHLSSSMEPAVASCVHALLETCCWTGVMQAVKWRITTSWCEAVMDLVGNGPGESAAMAFWRLRLSALAQCPGLCHHHFLFETPSSGCSGGCWTVPIIQPHPSPSSPWPPEWAATRSVFLPD